MDGNEANHGRQYGAQYGEQQTRPAIGIDAVTQDVDPAAVAETVERVLRFEVPVLVTVPPDVPAVRRKLEATTATLVDVEKTGQGPRQALARAGKERGLPGVVLYPDPGGTTRFAYEESVATFLASEEYVVAGHGSDAETAVDTVGVVVASDHDRDAISELSGELGQVVDEVVVVDDTNTPDDVSDAVQAGAKGARGAVDVVSVEADGGAVTAGVRSVTRQYPGCEAITVVGAATMPGAVASVPAMCDTVRDGEAELVVGRAVSAAEDAAASAGSGLRDRVRAAFGTEADPSRSAVELDEEVLVVAPEAARTIERQVTGDATRVGIIDAAIRSDLAVRVHEYTRDQDTNGEETSVVAPSESESVLLGRDSEVAPTVSVVMPTMNEEEGIRECIERVKRAVDRSGYRTEVIISDDSDDRTPEIARELGAIVVEPDQPGYGYAYRYAFRYCRGEYVVMGDADTTYDFEQFPTLLEPVVEGDADLVMGSRLEGEIKDGAMPALHQYVGNPALTRFLNVFYDAGVSDAHSGFRAFRADVLDELNLETDGMEFASEMIMDAGARELTIEEIPITYHEREGEATLESFRDGWRHVRFMLVNAPGYLFTVPGIGMSVVGVLVMLAVFADVSVGGVSFGIHTSIAGALLTLVGYQVANLGAFATVASDPIQRSDDIVTTGLIERLTLERMATVGVGIWLAGVTYAGWLIVQWAATGFTRLPMQTSDVIAFTAIVIGLQTVFNAFFLSAVSSDQ